ncbi:PIPO, partial [Lupinus mosaic virus]|uniref:PIPO n=1 Tax=Lupinus mosaic virus TaxID=573615 RepID=UPI0001F6BBFB
RKVLSKGVKGAMGRIGICWKITTRLLLVKAYSKVTARIAPTRRNRFERHIQRITTIVFGNDQSSYI